MRKRDYAKAKAARIARELAEPPKELESAIQARIVDMLGKLGCLVERRGEAQGRGGKGGGAFYTGEPDLRISYLGLTFGVEVKRDADSSIRDDQIAWMKKNWRHLPIYVVCSEQQALEAFNAVVKHGQRHSAYDCRVEPFHAWVRLT